MRLYFVPNDPERTTLMSANGVIHYQVTTVKARRFTPAILRIKRPAIDANEDTCVAEVKWKRGFRAHPVVRSHIFDGEMQELQVRHFLYKVGRLFSPTRYFLGSDDEEYRWKPLKDTGHVLTHVSSSREVARFVQETVTEGFFQGEKKWCLFIQPTNLDIDMIVVSFIIMEKRRRDRIAAEGMKTKNQDEDRAVEGGCETGGSGGALA
ncbi:hypothetical protein DICSQDRAFT_146329 [Dichomitus squalens LYAD-421 SS1]|uniref:uncharacterized protein n=1 Tax=Dichomitus squalens (strain LYAD-421) TaxID=732165 RepID=UPI0004411194|nr:uncharacterized protein DICSQDRAFT_146329 [Dichomitus squalens LYAD-421 SS1]EJF62655.1 hypothetical protein DICSQDRAFT_146329 [Dichomitus squalens LYAD-421 SS1]